MVTDRHGCLIGVYDAGASHDNQPVLKGTAGAGQKVRIYDHGWLLGETTTDKDGNWAFVCENALSNGMRAFSAAAVGANGAEGRLSNPFTVEINWKANVQTEGAESAVYITDIVTGSLRPKVVSADSAVTVHGEAGAGKIVFVYDKGVRIGVTTADEQGHWVLKTGQLDEGRHLLTVSQVDQNGHELLNDRTFLMYVDSAAALVAAETDFAALVSEPVSFSLDAVQPEKVQVKAVTVHLSEMLSEGETTVTFSDTAEQPAVTEGNADAGTDSAFYVGGSDIAGQYAALLMEDKTLPLMG